MLSTNFDLRFRSAQFLQVLNIHIETVAFAARATQYSEGVNAFMAFRCHSKRVFSWKNSNFYCKYFSCNLTSVNPQLNLNVQGLIIQIESFGKPRAIFLATLNISEFFWMEIFVGMIGIIMMRMSKSGQRSMQDDDEE